MKEYPTGNADFLGMLKSGHFDSGLADMLLLGVDVNTPICDLDGYSTTYLYEAVRENSLPAVRYLLENGADPNMYNQDLICDCALWELQYLYADQDLETRYEINKLFFKYGANPNIKCEGETLYDYIVYQIYNDPPDDDNEWENLRNLYKLLVLYGGGSETGVYGRPHLKDVDPEKADEYSIMLMRHKDGYHIIGKLIDGDGKVVGDL